MRYLLRAAAALGLSAALVGAPVAAETPISVGQGKPFKHKPSGIVVSADIAGGIPRGAVAQYDDKQLDVIVDYRSPGDTEVTTIFLFRNVTGDVPLWFDRIQQTVESGNKLGVMKLAIPPAAFTPAGQSNARGLRAVYGASGAGFTSSAAALTATGEWYVAVRESSKTLTPEQLQARLEQTFAAIQWPKEKVATPVAAAMTDCSKPLAQGEDAQPAPADTGSLLIASVLGGIVTNAPDKSEVVAPARWCRDPYKIDGAGVYRPDNSTDGYLIAFQDAGRGIWVGKNGIAGLLSSASEPTFMVESIDMDHRDGFTSFKTLPNVAQALWLAEKGARTYSSSTWGKNKNINISTDAIK